jgi:hypothetical protein
VDHSEQGLRPATASTIAPMPRCSARVNTEPYFLARYVPKQQVQTVGDTLHHGARRQQRVGGPDSSLAGKATADGAVAGFYGAAL